jgi:hypothetical protein
MPRCGCGWCESIREIDREMRPWWKRALFLPPDEVINRAVALAALTEPEDR